MQQEAKAQAKYVGRSPRKTMLVVNAIRGMQVEIALAQLKYMPSGAAKDVYKVVASAAANAQNKFGISVDNLTISEAFVDEAPMLKRSKAGSKGRGMRILKRNSHITVIVSEGNGTVVNTKEKREDKKTKVIEGSKSKKTPAVKKEGKSNNSKKK